MKGFDQSKVRISRKLAGLASGLLALQLSCVALGRVAANPALGRTALGVLSATALALAVPWRRLQYQGTGAMGEAARDAAEIVAGAVSLQGLRRLGDGEPGATAAGAGQRRRASGVSCRLWSRMDGFTLSGTR